MASTPGKPCNESMAPVRATRSGRTPAKRLDAGLARSKGVKGALQNVMATSASAPSPVACSPGIEVEVEIKLLVPSYKYAPTALEVDSMAMDKPVKDAAVAAAEQLPPSDDPTAAAPAKRGRPSKPNPAEGAALCIAKPKTAAPAKRGRPPKSSPVGEATLCLGTPTAAAPAKRGRPPKVARTADAEDAAMAAVKGSLTKHAEVTADKSLTPGMATGAATAEDLATEAAPASVHGVLFDAQSVEHVQAIRATMGIFGERGLQLGAAPVGRQQQFDRVCSVLMDCCNRGIGGSLYVSGLPGTGKSFTVAHAIKSVEQVQVSSSATGSTPLVVKLSCMALTEPAEVYRALSAACEAALNNGSKKSTTPRPSTASSGKAAATAAHDDLVTLLRNSSSSMGPAKGKHGTGPMFVFMLDEIDRLLADGTDEADRLFMLPHTAGVRVVVLAVANCLDLTERLLPALKCRGCQPELVTFPAYSKTAMCEILSTLSKRLPWAVFDAAALEYAARSMSSSSGDLRHALKACSLSVDLLADNNRERVIAHEHLIADYRIALGVYEAAAAATDAAPCTAAPTHASGAAAEAVAPNTSPCGSAEAATTQTAASAEAVQAAAAIASAGLGEAAAAAAVQLAAAGPPLAAELVLKRTVGLAEMVSAISRLTGRAKLSTASSVSTIRALPVQQQLVLLATAMSVAGAAVNAAVARATANDPDASSHSVATMGAFGRRTALSSRNNPFTATATAAAAADSSCGGSSKGAGKPLTPGGAMCAGDAAMQVTSASAYFQYSAICKELCMRPVPLAEFLDTAKLLSEMGLLRVGGGTGRGGGATVGSAAAGSGLKLCLKVMVRDVQSALKDNAVFRKVVGLLS